MQEAGSQHDLPGTHQDLVPIPSGFSPEGIAANSIKEIFCENTSYLLRSLPRQYFAIFGHILRYATLSPRTSMQMSLFTTIGEGNDEAIVLYKSIDALARAKGSPVAVETYGKAIILFEALQIISKRTLHCGPNERYTEIRIPLGKREILIPSLLQSLLRSYQEYTNTKARQVLVKTAKLLQTGEFASHIPRPVLNIDPNIRILLTQLLQEHGIEEGQIRAPSLVKTCSILSQVVQAQKKGRVGVQIGELVASRPMHSERKAGDSEDQIGEFGKDEAFPIQSHREKETDTQGDSVPTNSPSCPQKKGRRRAHCLQKGELAVIFHTESPDFEETGNFSPQKGEFVGGVSITDFSLSLDSSFKESNTFIDTSKKQKDLPDWVTYVDPRPHREIEREMQLYKNMFDPNMKRRWTGSLYNAVRWTPPELRRLAAIGAIFYQSFRQLDGTFIKRPGGWFTKACRRFQEPEALIPDELRAWDQTGLSLAEIERKVKQGIYHPSQETLFATGNGGVEASSPTAEMPSGQQGYAFPGEAPRSGRGGGWMNRHEAEDLCERIQEEGMRFAIRARVIPGNEAGVFLVETNWADVIERHANSAEWDQYFAETSLCCEPENTHTVVVKDHGGPGFEFGDAHTMATVVVEGHMRTKDHRGSNFEPENAHPMATVVVEDHMRTKEEWATVRDRFGEWADFLDPMISGKRGQDDRWAYAAYLNICDLGVSCSPRFLEMADETWGVVVDWGGTWYQITTERERIAFLSAAKREIQRQARLRERERSQNDFLQWQIEQARKEEARKSRSYNAQ